MTCYECKVNTKMLEYQAEDALNSLVKIAKTGRILKANFNTFIHVNDIYYMTIHDKNQ